MEPQCLNFASTSANTTINGVLSLGGTIALRSGNYNGAQLVVPATANLVAGTGVKGIKYASIENGARVDEPAFNTCFGNYISGSFTIATGAAAVASGTTWYLAFKPDRTISTVSTDCSTIQFAVNALENGGLIHYATGNFVQNSMINITTGGVYFEGEGIGHNYTATKSVITTCSALPAMFNFLSVKLSEFWRDLKNCFTWR